jgi:hypothetical protein
MRRDDLLGWLSKVACRGFCRTVATRGMGVPFWGANSFCSQAPGRSESLAGRRRAGRWNAIQTDGVGDEEGAAPVLRLCMACAACASWVDSCGLAKIVNFPQFMAWGAQQPARTRAAGRARRRGHAQKMPRSGQPQSEPRWCEAFILLRW